MTWGLVATAAATVVGGAISADGSRKAANGQKDAANAAAGTQQQGYRDATGAWNGAFDNSLAAQQAALGQYIPMQQQAYQGALQQQNDARAGMLARSQPYMQTGTDALSQLRDLMGYDPTPSASAVMAQPGYQAGLTQGRNVLEGSAAARGGLYSGNALKELTQYGNDYATTKYGQAFDQAQSAFNGRWSRLAGLAGMGQQQTNTVNSADQSYANNIGQLGTQSAQRIGSALLDNAGNQTSLYTGRANALGNFATGNANSLGNIYTNSANAQGAAALQQGAIWANGANQLGGLASYQLNKPAAVSGSNWGQGTANPYGGTVQDPWYG